jgi:hypothetical protein
MYESNQTVEDATYSLVDEVGNVLGVAVRVQVLDTTRFGTFLLTAGHTVKELYIQGRPVQLIRSDNESACSAKILACQWQEGEYDYALLYSDAWLGPALTCGSPFGGEHVIVRGSPSGVATAQTNLRAWIGGLETKNGLMLIDLVLEDFTLVEIDNSQPPFSSPFHKALRGLSGGPVFSPVHGQLVGIISTRNTKGIANRAYAGPVPRIAAELAGLGYVLRVAKPAPTDKHLAESAIAWRLIARGLRTHEEELILWEELSSLFYGGVPVDETLAFVLSSPEAFGIVNVLERARGDFLLARFALKRGHFRRARSLLAATSLRLANDTCSDFRILRSLVDLRMLVEAFPPNPTKSRQDRISRALGVLEESQELSDRLRAYELASAAGREAMAISTLLATTDSKRNLVAYFTRYRDLHHLITAEYGDALYDKQGMVEIALRLLSILWRTDGSASSDTVGMLQEAITVGHGGAVERKNITFEFPLLMSEAIAMKASGRLSEAFAAVMLASEGLRRAHLTLTHEGVSHVFAYMNSEDVDLATAMRLLHRHGLSQGVREFCAEAGWAIDVGQHIRRASDAVSELIRPSTTVQELVTISVEELF